MICSRPFAAELMVMWPVSTRVNSPDNDHCSTRQREPKTWEHGRAASDLEPCNQLQDARLGDGTRLG